MLVSCPGSPRPALLCPYILTSWPSFSKARSQGPDHPKRRQTSREKPKASSFLPLGCSVQSFHCWWGRARCGGCPVSEGHPVPLQVDSSWMASRSLSSSCCPSPPPIKTWPNLGRGGGCTGDGSGRKQPAGMGGGRGAGRRVPAMPGPRRPRPGCQWLSSFWPSPHGSFTHLSPPRSPRPSSPPTAPLRSPCCPFRTARPPAAPSPCH